MGFSVAFKIVVERLACTLHSLLQWDFDLDQKVFFPMKNDMITHRILCLTTKTLDIFESLGCCLREVQQ